MESILNQLPKNLVNVPNGYYLSKNTVERFNKPRQRSVCFGNLSLLLKDETSRKQRQVRLRQLLVNAINVDPNVKNKGFVRELPNSNQHASRAYEAWHCGDVRNYYVDIHGNHKRGNGGLYCNERLCTICAKRKAYKMRVKIETLVNYLNEHYRYDNGNPRYSLLFVTASIPNSDNNPRSFKEAHSQLNRSFNKMLHYKDYDGFSVRHGKTKKGRILGYISKLEETYNALLDTWNLHLHAFLIVHRSYFSSKYYIPFQQWRDDWERANKWCPCAHNGKHLQIWVERPFFKDHNGVRHHLNSDSTSTQRKKCRHSEVCELTAYETKSVDFEKILRTKYGLTKKQKHRRQQKTFNTAYFGLKHTRTYSFVGLFKRLNHLYETGQLDDYMPKDRHIYGYVWDTRYNYDKKRYQTRRWLDLTKQQSDVCLEEYRDDILKNMQSHGLHTVLTKRDKWAFDQFKNYAKKFFAKKSENYCVKKGINSRLALNLQPLSVQTKLKRHNLQESDYMAYFRHCCHGNVDSNSANNHIMNIIHSACAV